MTLLRRLRTAAVLLAAACGNGAGPEPQPHLALSPPWTTIEVNDSITGDTVRVRFVDAHGATVRADSVTWSSSDPTILQVAADGRLHAVRVGTATVRGTVGTAQAAQAITVSDPVFVGAGDIASCISANDEATARLLDTLAGAVFTVGDNDYSDGTPEPAYGVCFDSTWGRHMRRLRPAPGDDDRRGGLLDAYYGYFGAKSHPPTGAYSYDLGTWHIVVLNATPSVDTAQVRWLRDDLTAHPALCTLAITHRPRFSSGNTGSSNGMVPMFQALYDLGVELLVSGNDHDYERFASQAPDQSVDNALGVMQIVVGTGGKSHGRINQPLEMNSLAQNDDSYGVLRLVLHPDSYEWRFVPIAGRTFTDSGQRDCH